MALIKIQQLTLYVDIIIGIIHICPDKTEGPVGHIV